MYLSTPPASGSTVSSRDVTNSTVLDAGKSARCWKISAVLIFQRLADFPALFQQLAGRLDAGVYKLAVCKHEGLSALNVIEAGSSAAS